MNNIKAIRGQDVRSDDSHTRCIRAIHTLKNKLGLSDEDYRAMLFDNFKKSSSKDLTQKQQLQLITFLNTQYISTSQENTGSYKQQNYILYLAKGHITDLTAYCSKIVNRTISNIQDLTKAEASKVINSLKRYDKPRRAKHSEAQDVREQCQA